MVETSNPASMPLKVHHTYHYHLLVTRMLAIHTTVIVSKQGTNSSTAWYMGLTC